MNEKIKKKKDVNFDLLIFDEAQDLKKIYVQILNKIIQDFNIKKLLLLGDEKQSIYSGNNYL
jgi:ATP-dependent exoDNAse (exonuclease V) beta subunit